MKAILICKTFKVLYQPHICFHLLGTSFAAPHVVSLFNPHCCNYYNICTMKAGVIANYLSTINNLPTPAELKRLVVNGYVFYGQILESVILLHPFLFTVLRLTSSLELNSPLQTSCSTIIVCHNFHAACILTPAIFQLAASILGEAIVSHEYFRESKSHKRWLVGHIMPGILLY